MLERRKVFFMETPVPDFVHLHLHSQYSLLDGAIRLDPLFARAKEYGMHSVAITDHGTMFGAMEFYEKALKAGIKPIIGCECYVAPRSLTDKSSEDAKGLSHLVLLARNNEGYKNLCKLATIAQMKGFYYKPRVDDELLAAHSEGIIALSACLQGSIPKLLLKGQTAAAEEKARYYEKIFGEGNFFLEIQENGLMPQREANTLLVDMAERLSLPLVATNDCHYLDSEDTRAHELLLCIQTGKTIHDPNRFQFGTDALYFKSREIMARELGHFKGALANTVEIASRCDVSFDFNTYHFPNFPTEETGTAEELFDATARRGFEKRMVLIRKNNPDVDEKLYLDRLNYEIETINTMGFPGYFLIVADFIRYSKENGIPVGPGRGSAAGSMVAYAMGITDLDPIEHGLIFERFLNPSRISMPDIDVDFCINGREKVYEYVVKKYGGGDYVAQIITYGKMKTRAVLRDVGRALGIPLKDVDEIAKLVPEVLNISLEKALQQEPEILKRAAERSDIKELLDIAKKLEGLPRHASTHAAGVVIGDRRLDDYLPLYSGKKGEVVTQFDMHYVEKIGLVKFDFLGLRNLTVIKEALNLIALQGLEVPDLDTIPLDDRESYELLSRGDTTGVFQLESSGMKDLLVRLRPSTFGDITALVALYRPGPLESGMVDDFVERKHGRAEVSYALPQLEPILKDTYGVILYQEQVMKIAGVLANYSMAEADGLRKAMGKKIAEMMVAQRERFMKGAAESNIDLEKAGYIFDLMEKFGGYGFNKSHSAAYALIAYQTAYLKAHYPLAFMAALLTSEMNSLDGVVKFIEECRSHNIEVLPPDVNESGLAFTVVDDAIRFGLVAVKNVGEGPVAAILAEREANGPFGDIFDFCERIDLRKVNKRVLEALIKCGAFDGTGVERSRMMAVLDEAVDHGARTQKEKNDPQMGLFDMIEDPVAEGLRPVFPDIPEWEDRDLLFLEKEHLGLYLSGHPLKKYEEAIARYATTDAEGLKEVANGSAVRLGGSIHDMKVIITKKGDKMAFMNVEDINGTLVEVVVFPVLFALLTDLLEIDTPVIVEGEAQVEGSAAKIKAEKIVHLDKAGEVWTGMLHLKVSTDTHRREDLVRVQEALRRYPGNCAVQLHVRIPDKTETHIEFPDLLKVSAGAELMAELQDILGAEGVVISCAPAKLEDRGKNGKNGYRKRGNNGDAASA